MKTIRLLGLAGIALVSFSQPTWAYPRGAVASSGGSNHVGGGGRVGGVAGGGSRVAPAFYGGGFRAAPAFRGSSAYFTGRSVGGINRAPRYYYGGNRMTAARPRGFTRPVGRPASPSAGRIAAANRQPNRVGSVATTANRQPNRTGSVTGRNQVSNPRMSAAQSRDFVRNHASERHDSNWHHDWDRHHAHFHNNLVFVFVGGSWWGLYPWDYYPYYAYDYPYDYSYGNPYDYSYGSPYDYAGYYTGYSNDYNDQPGYDTSGQYGSNSTVSAVQSELARLGYYNGAIDGVLGDETEAALARYQQDQNLSVTGTADSATLQSLGLR